MERVCEKCGMELIDGVCPKCIQDAKTINKSKNKFSQFFMSPNEELVAVLGNSYLENFLHSGNVKKGFAVASDKRVYFQGKKYYVGEKGEIEENANSRVVDLRDVTGTGFDSFVDNGWLVLGIGNIVLGILLIGIGIGILLLLFAAYCMYKYYKSKHSFIVIQYAGGEIGYELKWFGNQEIELFQKQLRLAKDKSIEKEKSLGSNEGSNIVKISIADELSKLADLLNKGVITQAEFEKMKRDLI